MNERFLNELPSKISKGMYYRLDTYEEINKEDIEKTINKELEEYLNEEETIFMNEVVSNMTLGLEYNFVMDELKNYFDNSYLVKIKKGSDIKKTSKLADAAADSYDENHKQMFIALNKIIRKITTERPNDFEDVLNKISDKILNKSFKIEDTNEEDEDEDDDFEDLEDKKLDKLTTYINEITETMYKVCFTNLKDEFKKIYDDFLESNKDKIHVKVSAHMETFEKKNAKDFLENKRNNIVDLFEYLLDYYYEHIKWLDEGKYIIMVSTIKPSTNNQFVITSGSINPKEVYLERSLFIGFERIGTVLTAIMGERLI